MSNIAIDPAMSVYALVKRTLDQRTLINHRRTMLVISHEIENAILLDRVRARLFSGFQRMSRFVPQVERYQRIAARAESVYVFGVMDVEPPPIANVTYVPLKPSDQLAKEWFIVAEAQAYFTTLATEEVGADPTTGEAQFEGVWSFDEDMVDILHDWLTSLVGARPMTGDGSHNYQQQVKLMSSTMGRMTARMARALDSGKQPAYAPAEMHTAVQEQLVPALAQLEARG